MLVAELQELEEVKTLLTKGQQVGVLALARSPRRSRGRRRRGRHRGALRTLRALGIELVEDVDPAQTSHPEAAPEPAGSAAAPQAGDGARPEAGHDDRLPAAIPQGRRQGAAADRPGGGRAREADRARRSRREAEDGRVEPPARGPDREDLPQPGAAVPRPDPGGDAGPRPRGGEVRLPQGLQVLDLRDVVDPPGVARALADQARTIRSPSTSSRS